MKHLLKKYREGNISPEEFDRLSSMVSASSDGELSRLMQEDWQDFSSALMPPDRKKVRIRTYFSGRSRIQVWASAAAGLLFMVSAGLGLMLAVSEKEKEYLASREVTLSAGETGLSSVMLPDGTKVILNARSSITYPSDFGLRSRSVSISGQGFFDVAKDASKEFTVEAPGMEITVHGTKFNVYAYPDAEVSEMSLVEGSVSLRSGETVIDVAPNEKVCVTRSTGRMNLMKTDNSVETVWLSDRIVFINDPLYKVFDVLRRCFGVEIECTDDINLSDRYTGTFRDRRLGDILEILKMHYGFVYEYDGRHIEIGR